MPDTTPPLHTYHTAARGQLTAFLLPFVLLPFALFGLVWWDGTVDAEGLERQVAWWIYLITIVVFLLPPLLLRARAVLTTKYQISDDSVMSTVGFLSRRSAEVRIVDIRAINVDQTFADRLSGVGDVSFSSSASEDAEVIFHQVPRPFEIRTRVKELQNRLGAVPATDGTPSAQASSPATREAGAVSDAPIQDTDDRAALEELLAESEAESVRSKR